MATIKFYTRTSAEKLASINVRYVEGKDIKLRLVLPKMIFPSYWDEKRQTLTKNILGSKELTLKDALFIEADLRKLRDAILLSRDRLTGIPTTGWMQGVIDDFYKKKDPATLHAESLNQYIDRFISEARTGKRLCYSGSTKKAYSPGTIRSLSDFQHVFNNYQGIYQSKNKKDNKKDDKNKDRPYKPLNWQDINIDWYNEWISYFFGRNCSPNYIGKHLKTLKAILRQAREEGLPVNNEIDRKAFKVISAPSESIYLNENDLLKLYKLDLSSEKHLEIARDVFLVGCYTAQRYSDYSRICSSDVKTIGKSKIIELIQKKTGEKCIIPVSPECDTILKKYDYTLPKTYEQKINDRIKIIGKRAEINEVINFEQSRGGFRIKKQEVKADLIRTHTARRTGCTLMYLAGIPVIDIMRISGHKTEREFLKYIKVSKEQTAVNLANHPYFRKSRLKVV